MFGCAPSSDLSRDAVGFGSLVSTSYSMPAASSRVEKTISVSTSARQSPSTLICRGGYGSGRNRSRARSSLIWTLVTTLVICGSRPSPGGGGSGPFSVLFCGAPLGCVIPNCCPSNVSSA